MFTHIHVEWIWMTCPFTKAPVDQTNPCLGSDYRYCLWSYRLAKSLLEMVHERGIRQVLKRQGTKRVQEQEELLDISKKFKGKQKATWTQKPRIQVQSSLKTNKTPFKVGLVPKPNDLKFVAIGGWLSLTRGWQSDVIVFLCWSPQGKRGTMELCPWCSSSSQMTRKHKPLLKPLLLPFPGCGSSPKRVLLSF